VAIIATKSNDYTIVVGDISNQGAAYIYKNCSSSAPCAGPITLSAPHVGEFGYSVSISGNLLVVGAPGVYSKGEAYLYLLSGGSSLGRLHETFYDRRFDMCLF